MTIKQAASSLAATESFEGPSGIISSTSNSQYPLYSLAIEGCVYRGEGNANLVVAIPSERKVIRLRKSLSSANVVANLQEEETRVRREEVDFIERIISVHLGVYVCSPEILRCDYSDIARLSDKIRSSRPENRLGKDIIGTFVTKYPDYTYLSDDLQGDHSTATFCVEIKPKQSHLCSSDRLFQKCPYCLTQYYKTQNGSTKQPSEYCPFDLFSGIESRSKRALTALLHSPQNNLKIFKNGKIVYDEFTANDDESSLKRVLDVELALKLDELLNLLGCALARPFDGDDQRKRVESKAEVKRAPAPKRLDPKLVERTRTLLKVTNQACDMSSEPLVVGSVLERILRMQKLHQTGADVVTWIHANLHPILPDNAVFAEFNDARQVYRHVENDGGLSAVKEKAVNEEMKKDVLEYFSLDECYEILRNYLLFCTAKDCSILIAFQRIAKDSKILENSINRIDISKDQSFLVSVRILDLDMKKLQCIEKHRRRDNDVLQAAIQQLEEQFNL